MSMSELAYDIEQLYIDGHRPKTIALMLECPIETVYDWLEEIGVLAPEPTEPSEYFDL
jgi:transposase